MEAAQQQPQAIEHRPDRKQLQHDLHQARRQPRQAEDEAGHLQSSDHHQLGRHPQPAGRRGAPAQPPGPIGHQKRQHHTDLQQHRAPQQQATPTSDQIKEIVHRNFTGTGKGRAASASIAASTCSGLRSP